MTVECHWSRCCRLCPTIVFWPPPFGAILANRRCYRHHCHYHRDRRSRLYWPKPLLDWTPTTVVAIRGHRLSGRFLAGHDHRCRQRLPQHLHLRQLRWSQPLVGLMALPITRTPSGSHCHRQAIFLARLRPAATIRVAFTAVTVDNSITLDLCHRPVGCFTGIFSGAPPKLGCVELPNASDQGCYKIVSEQRLINN